MPRIVTFLALLFLVSTSMVVGVYLGESAARQALPLACSWDDSTMTTVDSILKARACGGRRACR